MALPTLDALPIALGPQQGRVVLVHFFATWCEPCRTELPALDRLVAASAADVAVLAISVAEPDDRVRRYFSASPAGFPVLLDRDRAVTRAWGVFALPTSIVLDRRLQPVLRADGDVAWDDPGVRAVLQGVIQPPAPPATAEPLPGTSP